MTWTRAHDAHIARECEGLEVANNDAGWFVRGPGGFFRHADYYSTDPAAAIRAAEAWKVKDQDVDRTIELLASVVRMDKPCTVTLAENYRVGDRYEWRTFEGVAGEKDIHPWSAALAQALLRATGGPE